MLNIIYIYMDLWVEGWICEIGNGLWKFGN